jgi:hypothetical protein
MHGYFFFTTIEIIEARKTMEKIGGRFRTQAEFETVSLRICGKETYDLLVLLWKVRNSHAATEYLFEVDLAQICE